MIFAVGDKVIIVSDVYEGIYGSIMRYFQWEDQVFYYLNVINLQKLEEIINNNKFLMEVSLQHVQKNGLFINEKSLKDLYEYQLSLL